MQLAVAQAKATEEARARWAAWLRARMAARKLTAVAVAEAVGLSHTAVGKWRNGAAFPSDVGQRLAWVLGVTESELLAAAAGNHPGQ